MWYGDGTAAGNCLEMQREFLLVSKRLISGIYQAIFTYLFLQVTHCVKISLTTLNYPRICGEMVPYRDKNGK